MVRRGVWLIGRLPGAISHHLRHNLLKGGALTTLLYDFANFTFDSSVWEKNTAGQFGLATVYKGNSSIDLTELAIKVNKNILGQWKTGLFDSLGLKAFDYGKFSASIKRPAGRGFLPAFWMLGESYDPNNDAGTWPACGEIDVIELIGDGNYYCTIHGPMVGGASVAYTQAQEIGALGFDPTVAFHTYWCNHLPGSIEFGIDTTSLGTLTPDDIPAGATWALDSKQYVLFDIGVGGGWAPDPDATTPNTSHMYVDWFRWDSVP